MRQTGIHCLVLLGLLCASAFACTDQVPPEPLVDVGQKVRSVTLDSRRAVTAETLVSLKDLGVTHLTLIVFGWQSNSSSPDLTFRTDGRWFTESDAGITAIATVADSLGLSVIIKPHLWVRNEKGGNLTRDKIGFSSETEWTTWESQYRTFILHYATLSENVGASLYVIGTELRRAATERPQFWRQLIRDVRHVYSGQLTYASNWYKEYQEVTFWSDLDFIGVQSYFPISSAETPSMADLKDGWKEHSRNLKSLSAAHGKPVLFTELGYRSAKGAASEPWVWAPRNTTDADVTDLALQADLYSAFFETMWVEKWFAGAIVWKWNADPPRSSGKDVIDFTPKGKPASDVIARWFLADAP